MYLLHYNVWRIILNYQLVWLMQGRRSLKWSFSVVLFCGRWTTGRVWELRFVNAKLLELNLPELVSKDRSMLRDGCWMLLHEVPSCFIRLNKPTTWAIISCLISGCLSCCKKDCGNERGPELGTKHFCVVRTRTLRGLKWFFCCM